MLWEQPDRLDAIVTLLDRRIETEPLTSVRLAMLGTINSVSKHHPEQGLSMVARIARHDPHALLGHHGQHVLGWAKFRPSFDASIIPGLIAAPDLSLKALGLKLEAALALLADERGVRFTSRFSTPLARQVAAFMASANITNDGTIGAQSLAWLQTLWNDPELAVREEANRVDWSKILVEGPPRNDLVASHIASSSFDDHPDRLLRDLQGWVAVFPEATLAMVRKILESTADDTEGPRRGRHMSAHYLGQTLVELYRAVEGDADRERVLLDHFDAFLANDLYDIRRQIGAYERH